MKLRNRAITSLMSIGFAVAAGVGVASQANAATLDLPHAPSLSLASDLTADSESYAIQVTAQTGHSITYSYRLGSALTLTQEGAAVRLSDSVQNQAASFPTTFTTSKGKVVSGHWTLTENSTVTFTIDNMGGGLAHGAGAAKAGGVSTSRVVPADYMDCLSQQAIGDLRTGAIGGCIATIEAGCAGGALLGGLGGFIAGTITGLSGC